MKFLETIGSLTSKRRHKSSFGYLPTSPATKGRILNILGIRHLETMPAQALRAFQLASDPTATSADFVKVVESDEVLSARVIRIANSVYFFRGAPANDIEKAIANIGLDELRCLLSATMLRSLLQGKGKAREQVWANALATGIGCRHLSKFCDLNEGEAFLCGLVHDIGKIIIIRQSENLYEKVIQRVSSGEKRFVDAEEEVFELNHVEVGQWIGEHWNFPPLIIEAIANHHRSWESLSKMNIQQHRIRSLVVKAADTLAHALGAGHPHNYQGFQKASKSELSLALQQMGIMSLEQDNFIKSFEAQYQKEIELYAQ